MRFLTVGLLASAFFWSNSADAARRGHARPAPVRVVVAAPPVVSLGPVVVAWGTPPPPPAWIYVDGHYDYYGRWVPGHWARR